MSLLGSNGLSYNCLFNEVAGTVVASTVVADQIQDTGLTANTWVGSNASQTLESRILQGTANQVNITNVGTTYTLGTDQDIDPAADVTFNSVELSSLTPNAPVRTDSACKLTTGPTTLSSETTGSLPLNRLIALTATQPVRSDGSGFLTTGTTNISSETAGSLPVNRLVALTATQPVRSDASGFLTTGPTDINLETTGTLTIARGGTNSATTLANGCLMVSSGSKIVEGTSSSSPSFSGTVSAGNLAVSGSSVVRSLQFASLIIYTSLRPYTVNIDISGNVGWQAQNTANSTWSTVIRDGSGNFGANNITLAGLTASMPVKTDGTQTLTSALINLASDVTGVAPVANGGTNSSTALVNGCLMVSTGSKIVEGTSSSSPTFTGNITAANLTGTNSGNVTLTTVGSVPNTNAASLVGQQLQLQPANGSNPGVVSTGAQTLAGAKTFSNQTAITDATATTSSSTGALVVTGGIGCGSSIDVRNGITVENASNQLTLGGASGGNTQTINASAPAANRTVTIPDPGNNSSFVLTEGAQTLNGNKTVSGTTNLSGLTASQLLALDSSKNIINGGILIYPTRATLWPDEMIVTVGGGTLTPTFDAAQRYGGYTFMSTGTQNDAGTWSFHLAAGTYTFKILGRTQSNAGQLNWAIDGTTVVSTGADWYSASTGQNVTFTYTNISVAGNGRHILKLFVPSKNAASTGYFAVLTKIWVVPASDTTSVN